MAKKKNDIDHLIEQAYYKQAQGYRIDVMKISDLYADVKKALATGIPLEAAMGAAIKKFCEPTG